MNPEFERAARSGDAAAFAALLDRGMDVNSLDRHGQTALMLAAQAGHIELVNLLIARGASPDVTAKYGLSALMLAVVAGYEDVGVTLVRAGADLALRGTGTPGFLGKNAYDLATEMGMHTLCNEISQRGGSNA